MEDVSLIVSTAKPSGSAIVGDWTATRKYVEGSREMLIF
jgi:hypothetical protein